MTLHFRPRQACIVLLPVLYEALIADPLWEIVYCPESLDGGLPDCDHVETTVLNENGVERRVVPLWTRREYAEQFRLGQDGPFRDRMYCVESCRGGRILERLAQRQADIVIDHGHDGLILRADAWQPAFALHGKTGGIDLLQADLPLGDWEMADPDDFPVWSDRLTSLLRNIELARWACLLWLNATPDAPRRLCLVTFSAVADVHTRIHDALPLLAQGVALPPLAYLPLKFGDKLWRTLRASAFYSDDVAHALRLASGKPSSRLYRL